MKNIYEKPQLELIEFNSSDDVSFTLNQSAVFNNTLSKGIGENSAGKVFGVGKVIDF